MHSSTPHYLSCPRIWATEDATEDATDDTADDATLDATLYAVQPNQDRRDEPPGPGCHLDLS